MRAQGEHDAEEKEIDNNLAQGKYGDATSELAQTRANSCSWRTTGPASARRRDRLE
jgi:hypothetical protein